VRPAVLTTTSFARRAYDAGHRDGLSHGEDDARHRRELRIDRDGDYSNADDGYRREYGDRENYRRAFRQGYESGYTEGFNRRTLGSWRRSVAGYQISRESPAPGRTLVKRVCGTCT